MGLTCIPLLLISACLLYLCAYCTDAATVLIFQRRLSRGLPGPIPAAGRLFRLHRGFRLASLLCSLAAVFSLCFSLWASRSNLPLTQWEPDFPLFSLATVEGRGWVPDETYSERVYPDPLRPNLYDSVTFHFNEVDITRAPMQAAYRIEQSGSGTRGNAAMMIAYHTELTVHSAQGRLERMEQAALSGDGYYSQLPASPSFQSAAVRGRRPSASGRTGSIGRFWPRRTGAPCSSPTMAVGTCPSGSRRSPKCSHKQANHKEVRPI